MKYPWWQPETGATERNLVLEVLESDYLNDGKATKEFEGRIAELVGAEFAVGVTSCTAALSLSLMARGIGFGDEVIVPDMTFIATANAVSMVGARPVLVDVDPETLCLSPEAFEAAITLRTKSVIPVYISGRAGRIDEILEIAARHGIDVIEDAAEALLSRRKGKALGTLGTLGCYSFSPMKKITTGQGGVIVTDDEQLATRIRELKDQGRPVTGTGGDDTHAAYGYNFKLTNLQAAVGLGQLDYLDERNERLKSIYRVYRDELADVSGISVFPFDLEGGEAPQWVDCLAENRDALCAHLAEREMDCRKFWFPLHSQAPYRQSELAFPNATQLAASAAWLPSAFQLSDDDARRICDEIRRFYRA